MKRVASMVVLTLCAGCGAGDGASSATVRSATGAPGGGSFPAPPPQSATPALARPAIPPLTYSGLVTPELQAIIDAALADAAKRSGLPVSLLAVVSAEAVVWADGSLGCPAPGAFYTMALVPGHRVRIRARGEVLDYHAGGRQLILCPAGRAVDPLPLQSS